ncbi:MAG: putative lipid II flippase FtsW, partial [Acidimicrobiales bacterium]
MAPARLAVAAHRPPSREEAAHRPATGPLVLAAVVLALVGLGVVLVLSASSVTALREHGTSWYVFRRQALCAAVGAVGMALAARFDYRGLRVLAAPALIVSAILLALVVVPGAGLTVSGATRWLAIGPIVVQPSELAKLALVLFCAALLTRRADRMDDTRFTLRPVLLVVGLLAVLVMTEPDLGTTLVLGGTALAILFIAGTPLRSLALVGAALAGVTLLAARLEPYRWERLISFLNPWADASNTGYQATQSLVALGSGRLTGVGLGAGRAKWGFLPAAHTDFIFAVIGEELGLLGGLVVVGLFATLTVLGVRAALRAPDRFGLLVAAGITAWFAGQAVLNIGAVVRLLPITGIPLPFLSAGGSSLVVSMVAAGILVNIARQARPPAPRRPRARGVP